MIFKIARSLIFIFLSLLVLAGCTLMNNNANQSTDPSDLDPNKFNIVTSFYPVYIPTINIAKGISTVQVVNLTKSQTGCLHDYQLSPGDLRILELADAFVINGAGMESFLEEVILQNKNLIVVDASTGIDLLKNADGEINPHVWVSVSNAMIQAQNIADQLAIADPTNKNQYESNAKVYIDKLGILKKDMHEALDKLNNREIITFHEAFPYFAQEFKFTIAAVIEREPGTSPTPRELSDTIDIISGSGIKALFAEPQYSAKAADIIAEETGAIVYVLDPAVTGTAEAKGFDDYIQIMEQNSIVLQEALN
jgi:zinc transport system substrate-binding protein